MKTIATIIGIAVGLAILIIVGDNLDIIRNAIAQLTRLFVQWLTLTLYAATDKLSRAAHSYNGSGYINVRSGRI